MLNSEEQRKLSRSTNEHKGITQKEDTQLINWGLKKDTYVFFHVLSSEKCEENVEAQMNRKKEHRNIHSFPLFGEERKEAILFFYVLNSEEKKSKSTTEHKERTPIYTTSH